MDSKTYTHNCWTCDREFQETATREMMLTRKCPECHAKERAEAIRINHEAKVGHWKRLCPIDFQATELEKLPCQLASKQVLAWEINKRGMVLLGPTGTGKSRTVWMLLEKVHMSGKKIQILNSLSGVMYASKFSESAYQVEAWLEKLITVDLLFMDDIFKNKLTDSFEGAIFSIIDQRTENGRPIIVTANDTGSTLASRMTGDRGEPMVRRLREFCDGIIFEK